MPTQKITHGFYYSGPGPHHNMWDSHPAELTKAESVQVAEELWPTQPDQAGTAYTRALFLRYQNEHLPLFWARAGAMKSTTEERQAYFTQARDDARKSNSSEEVYTEINALEEWGDRNEADKVLPLPAEFVSDRLEALKVGQLALVATQEPEELAA